MKSSPNEIEEQVLSRLKKDLNIKHFEVKDFTGRHLNHKLNDGGFHLETVIVSDDFKDKSLIERHKMVYKAVGNLIKHEIHALSMKTLTIIEWKNS